ncbi:hypothetical protein [Aestuariivivens sediminis]|uniref:hypothetical protein n=1 Tax=Aestuariivivens sediminis TaxID=2913557 RepID=UPI001F57BB1B|nr:hypothetical protein [Aestuariivivens sediminis]
MTTSDHTARINPFISVLGTARDAGFPQINGQEKKVLSIPDSNTSEEWDRNMVQVVEQVAYTLCIRHLL